MRVMVTVEARLLKMPDGNIYSAGTTTYDFFSRYLEVFEEVVVLARVGETNQTTQKKLIRVDGPNIRVFELPCYIGPWQFLRCYRKLNVLAKRALQEADAFVLRIPGTVGSVLWRQLMKNKIPYGVVVVTDPWDVFTPGAIECSIRPVIRRIAARQLRKQCRHACAAVYVTEYWFQKRYPPGGWSTHYSSVNLYNEQIASESIIDEHMNRFASKKSSNEPLRISYIGTLEQLYKGPDILIKAFAYCVNKGLNLELVIIGDGRCRGQLEDLTRELGVSERVKFTGRLLKEEVFNELDKVDLYVLPTRGEGLPRTLIEAMARGLPCISTAVSGVPELLAAEDLVPPRDPHALGQKIEQVVNAPLRLERMARRNLKSVQRYRKDKLDQRRRSFYEKLVEASKKSPRNFH